MKSLLILGAGGFGRMVAETAQALGYEKVVFRKAVLAGNTMKAVHADETFHLQIIHSAQLNRLTKMWELLSPLNGAMFLSVQNANRLEPNTSVTYRRK